ncbi:SPOCS domain-containing protein [Romboutsia sp.]|uniref:SPOCS domain-containing protein n=1 Tax=Romboutsia sp. TaxID=1965302 RepID=UPI003F34FA45
MNTDKNYVDINIKISQLHLSIYQEANLTLEIKNNCFKKIENLLIKNFINKNYIIIQPNDFNISNNIFTNIGNLEPNETKYIQLPLKVNKSIPSFNLPIFTLLNFNLEEDGQFIDMNIKSNVENLSFHFADIYGVNGENFHLSTSKDVYLINEDIDYSIKIVNTGNLDAYNIYLNNCVPKHTNIINESIVTSKKLGLRASNDFIFIDKIKSGEEISIKYNVSIVGKIEENYIENQVQLEYVYNLKDKVMTNIQSLSNLAKVSINKNLRTLFRHTTDKYSTFIGDTVTHIIHIKNTTESLIKNMILKETIPTSLKFIENSLIINGVYIVGENIYNYIKLGELDINEELIISYKTTVDAVKNTCNIAISSKLEYNSYFEKIHETSYPCTMQILCALFESSNGEFLKEQAKNEISIGDTIEYKITLQNKGNIKATNVILKDTIQDGLQFVNNSLFINDCIVIDANLLDGICLKDINPSEIIIIKYKAKVLDISYNDAHVRANLSFMDNKCNKIWQSYSNDTYVTILAAKICGSNGSKEILKEVNNKNAQIGDIITFSLIINNIGNLDCESLKVHEPFNPSLEFIDGSLSINNKIFEEDNIYDGLMINKLKVKDFLNIKYQARVIGFPKPNPINDRAIISYSYVSNDNIIYESVETTKPKIYVNNANLVISDIDCSVENKQFLKYSNYGEYIFFSLLIENKGNVCAEDIVLKFNFSSDTEIDFNSFKINNIDFNQKIYDSVILDPLGVYEKIFISFKAKVLDIKAESLDAYFYIDYTFRGIESKNQFKKNYHMKESIILMYPSINVEKKITENDIQVGRFFTEFVTIQNTGNMDLLDILVNLNKYEFLKLNVNSIMINGNLLKDSVIDDNVKISKLRVNENINISFRYEVIDIPIFDSYLKETEVYANYIPFNQNEKFSLKFKSNILKLDIKYYSIKISDHSNLDSILLSKQYNYLFYIKNEGNSDCEYLDMKLNLPECFNYVKNSLSINGKSLNVESTNDFINLGLLKPNCSIYLDFCFEAVKIPYKKKAHIDLSINANFYSQGEEIIKKKFTNDKKIITIENVDLEIIKKSSSQYLQSDDIVNIQTILTNTGTIDLSNLYISNNYNSSLSFIKNSICINNKTGFKVDAHNNITIDNLPSTESIILSGDYKYTPMSSSDSLSLYSDVDYSYIHLDGNISTNLKSRSNTLCLDCSSIIFKQINIEDEYSLESFEPDIREVTHVSTEAIITGHYSINTIKNKSYDNLSSTGNKIIIKGIVKNRIEYLVEDEHNSMYMITRDTPFTTFINIPIEYHEDDLDFSLKCDNVYFKSLGSRMLFITSLISID